MAESFFIRYLSYKKIELARFRVYLWGVHSVWKIQRKLESVNVSYSWLADLTGTRNRLCCFGKLLLRFGLFAGVVNYVS